MAGSFLSSSWYRVARLHPRLRDQVDVHIHRYNGEVWYILQDALSGQTHRLAGSAYAFVSMLDGRRTLDAIWTELAERLGNEAPSQDEIISLMGRLFAAEMIQTEMPPDARELLRRFEQKERKWFTQTVLNPMAIKLPLWDPDAFLQRTLPYVRWVFSWVGLALWLLAVGRAGVLVAQHWTDLSANIIDRLISADNLLLLSASVLVLKVIHEFAHGYAVKSYGGEVHELGMMLLVFMPMAYVDASYSTGFRDKRQRIVVAAAGILVELFIAAIALDVWLAIDAGTLRTLMFNVMVVAGFSAVLFNGNPLLRYDGYYVLSDLLEMPNLATRATSYWAYLADRYLLSVADTESPAHNAKERFWFFVYAPAAFFWRLFIMIGIALMLATKYLIVGVLIGLWTIVNGLLRPVWTACSQLLQSGRYQRDRRRVVLTAAGLAGFALLFVAIVPVPLHTNAPGVVWLPETAIVRAGADGFVDRQRLATGTMVSKGQVLVDSSDPDLTERVRELEGKQDEMSVQLNIDREKNRVDENLSAINLAQTTTELNRQRQLLAGLSVASQADGRLIVSQPDELVGTYNKRGSILAFVAPQSSSLVRAMVSQDDIGLVRNHLRGARIMLTSDTRKTYAAQIVREVPGAVDVLPSPALAIQGGGDIATDPRDTQNTKLMAPLFEYELRLPADAPSLALGSRVYVRFEHEWEPIGQQLYRRIRQLLMSRLNG